MKARFKPLAALAISTLFAWSTPAVFAQSAPSAAAAVAYTDRELKSVAQSIPEVQRITSTYQSRMDAAATQEEQTQVQAATTAEARQALEDKGITLEKYPEILTVAHADPRIAEKIRQHFQNSQR